MTKIFSSAKQYSCKFVRSHPIRTIVALLIAPGLSYILVTFLTDLVIPSDGYDYTFAECLLPLRLMPYIYLMSVPLCIPCLLLFRAFRVSAAVFYVTIGMVTGLLNYWIFHECYKVYQLYQNGTMNFSQAIHQIWKISNPGVAFVETILWGLTGFIFWMVVHWNEPIAPGPSSQDIQG